MRPRLLLALSLSACQAQPAPAELAAALPALHRPVYDAFALGEDDEALHALLERVFVGEALTREYVEQHATLARLRDEQTAVAVLAVDYGFVEADAPEPEGPTVVADWQVTARVDHQGHTHLRVNRYEARFALASTADGPRIARTWMRDAERLPEGLATLPEDGAWP